MIGNMVAVCLLDFATHHFPHYSSSIWKHWACLIGRLQFTRLWFGATAEPVNCAVGYEGCKNMAALPGTTWSCSRIQVWWVLGR